MKAADKIIELQKEKKELEEILYSLKNIFFGRASYAHEFSELTEEVQKLMDSMAKMEGRKDATMELLQFENHRLYLLVRFLSGDKEAFKPMVFDGPDGRREKFPISHI